MLASTFRLQTFDPAFRCASFGNRCAVKSGETTYLGVATSVFIRYSASLLMSVIIFSLYSIVLRVCDSARAGWGEGEREREN